MVNFLLCFSVIKNTKAVLNTDVPKGSITSINGMRTLSITWVVLGHTLGFAIQFIGRYELRKIPLKELVFSNFLWANVISSEAVARFERLSKIHLPLRPKSNKKNEKKLHRKYFSPLLRKFSERFY